MAQEFLGIEIEGIPFGAGPGAINGTDPQLIMERSYSMARSPAALDYFGSIGSRWNDGNGGETYFHDPTTGETVNAMGLPGIGIDLAKPVITELSKLFAGEGKAFVVSVSTLAGEQATEILPILVERVSEAGAPVVEVNYSCPNVVTAGGGRNPMLGFDPEAIIETRQSITNRVGTGLRIVEKLPPYLGENRTLIPEIAKLYTPELAKGVVAVTGFNTIPGVELKRNGKPVLRIIAKVQKEDGGAEEVITHAGGLSGPAIADQMYELQEEFCEQLPDNIKFIAAGGVGSGTELHRRTGGKIIGATGVTVFWEGEKVGRDFGATARNIAIDYAETAA